jgi:ubiquinone/menaquinone biosynthesis C-methylase UbiE
MKIYADQKKLTEVENKDASKLDLRNEIQEEYRSHPAPWFGWVFAHLRLPENARILEIGCGSGMLWQENLAEVSPRWEIILSDLSRGMVSVARNNLTETILQSRFLSLNSQGLPFQDETFDAVLAIGVLDQVPDLNLTLCEVQRILRPSGLFMASAGGREHLLEMRTMLKPYVAEERAELLGGEEDQFGLENGKQILEPHFDKIARYDYLDRMQFIELQPILDYVLSEEAVVWDLRLHRLSQFVWELKHRLIQEGKIEVGVQKCLFTARKQAVGVSL